MMARQCNVDVKDRREAVSSLLPSEEAAVGIARGGSAFQSRRRTAGETSSWRPAKRHLPAVSLPPLNPG